MADWVELWTLVLQSLTIFQGCYVLGASLFILRTYSRMVPRVDNGVFKYMLAISISYIGMNVLMIRSVALGTYSPSHPFWYLASPALIAFYFLGDYGLMQMATRLKHKENEQHETQVPVDLSGAAAVNSGSGVDRIVEVAASKTKRRKGARLK